MGWNLDETIEGNHNLSDLPHKTGVYIFLNEKGKPLYIGKAKDLKARARSHFSAPEKRERKIAALTKEIDWLVTENETEALILENNLIKEHKPRYNIQLKDDKSYPWLKITNERYPALVITRNKKDDEARYFGPYGDVGALRETVKFIRKIFPVRNCNRAIKAEQTRVCLDYHIDRCAGPCAGKIDKEAYEELIEQVILFLRGEKRDLLTSLRRKMNQASENMRFKRAAHLKERINALEKTVKKQRVVLSDEKTLDVLGVVQKGKRAIVEAFFIRKGQLIGQTHFPMKASSEKEKKEIVAMFIKQYYSRASYIPPRIVTPVDISDRELVTSWLSRQKDTQVCIAPPKTEKEKELVRMTQKNAEIFLEKETKEEKIRQMKQKKKSKALAQLKKALDLPSIPTVVEGYDVSNIQGAGSTGSKVCFKHGTAEKKEYRHYDLETEQPNDYALMHELVSRRLKKGELPDLFLIDGGKGQVSAAAKALEKDERNIPIIGLAKSSGQVYTQEGKVQLPNDSPALLLLKQIRDEAHRFAISYHRKLRRRIDSELDELPGIGEKRKRRLLLHFGSIEEIKKAEKEDLQEVQGIGQTTARKIYERFHKES